MSTTAAASTTAPAASSPSPTPTSTTPTSGLGSIMAKPGVLTAVKFLALVVVSVIAHGLLLKHIPMPAFLQDWLSIIWLAPFLWLIDSQLDGKPEKWLMYGLLTLWFAGCSVISVPKMFKASEVNLTPPASIAEQRAVTSGSVDGATQLEPPVLAARLAYLKRAKEGEVSFARQFDADFEALNKAFDSKALTEEQYLSKMAALDARMDAWKLAHAGSMHTASSSLRGRGWFNTSLWILAAVVMAFTWFIQRGSSKLVKIITWAAGTGITLFLVGDRITEWFSSFTPGALSGTPLTHNNSTVAFFGFIALVCVLLMKALKNSEREH